MTEVVHITDEQLAEVCRTMLLRQWWYAQKQVLQEPNTRLKSESKWAQQRDKVYDEMFRRGILRKGSAIPRDGAEDLARDVDELVKARYKK